MIGRSMKRHIIAAVSAVFVIFGTVGAFADSMDLLYDTIYTNTPNNSELVLSVQKWQNSDLFNNGFVQGEDGIYSVRMDLRMSGTYDGGSYRIMQFANNKRIDASGMVETGELRFKLMLEAADENTTAENVTMWFKNWDDSTPAWCDSKGISIPNAADIKADGAWYDVRIPLSDMKPSGEFDWSKLASIAMTPKSNMESTYSFYFRDIEIYNVVQSPTLSFAGCEVNKNGMFVVHTEMSDAIDSETVAADKFSVNGVTAKSVTVDGKKIDAVFDTDITFPSDVRMEIAGGIESVYGLGLETEYIDFTTSAVQDKIYIEHAGAPKLSGNTVSVQLIVKSLYSEGDAGQSVAALIVIYDGNKVIAANGADIAEIKRGKTKSVRATAEIPEGITLENPRAEVYFYDSMENRKPIAEMKGLAMQQG